MSKYPKLSHFVSEIDQFIQAFDREHPGASLSQQKEQQKYARIYQLRDHVSTPQSRSHPLWEEF